MELSVDRYSVDTRSERHAYDACIASLQHTHRFYGAQWEAAVRSRRAYGAHAANILSEI